MNQDGFAVRLELLVMAIETYEEAVQEARKASLEGVDVYALEADEYEHLLQVLTEKLKDQMVYTSECVARPKDAFQFMGIDFVKQE